MPQRVLRVPTKELARWFDMTPQHLTQLTRDGLLKQAANAEGKPMVGRYEIGENVSAFVKHLKKLARKDYSGEEEFQRLRNQKMSAEAQMADLRLRQLKGELLDRHRVEEIMGNLMTTVKNHLLAIPSRVSRLVLGLTTFAQVYTVLMEAFRLALREITEFDVRTFTVGESGTTNGAPSTKPRKKARAVRRRV